MKTVTRIVSAAALAVSISAVAVASHAAVFAQIQPISGNADYKWVRSTGAGTGGHFFTINSTASTVAQAVSSTFSFLDPSYAAIALVSSTFTVDATAANGNPAIFNIAAGTWTQTGLNGNFHITYNGPATTLGTFNLIPGENLLSGVFTDAWIQGAGGSGSTNVTIGNGGNATYTSDVYNFGNVVAGTQEFAFNLLAVTPHFGASAGKALNSFRANGGGNFAADFVPEPATWGLMILGFGGIGAMLRRRRLAGAVA